ncbi:MAG: tRNA A-37 threonylcarbamoyl transferase component Bud32 [Candidatus Azotimanducaceae bacterium]|jgi:tRNA A-37 threonylcarbamoyl transferase component Bud32
MTIVDSKLLIDAHRDVTVPFKLRVRRPDGDEIILTFKSILRLLPGKRIVALAHCDGKAILVKTFLGRTAKRYVSKERLGIEYIALAGVRTPELLWQADLLDGHGKLLAFEYLDDSISLQASWDQACEDEDRVDVLTRAMIIIAKLHNQGVVQADIHLGNFLMSHKRIYTIDGGGVVRKSEPPLAELASMENLSWFFAQFFPKFDDLIQIVFPAYEAVRGWGPDPDRVVTLFKKVTESRESRKKYYLDKAFRDCTRFVCQSSFSRFMVCERKDFNSEMESLLLDPDKYIDSGRILKDGNSATVSLVQLSNRSLVIKRYNIKNPWHAIKRAMQKTRAWLSWSNAYHMEFLGIRSLKPVAMLEHRMGPLRNKAYFITEYIEGPDALAYLPTVEQYGGEIEELASMLLLLSKNKISHGDLKATNFVMAKEGPVIIDLDAMREHKNAESFKRAFDKDIDRFMKNWEDQPELSSRFEGLLEKLSSS